MICKGWKHAGFLRAFDKEFQIQAMKDNMTTLLFPTRPDSNTSSAIEVYMRNEDVTSSPNDSIKDYAAKFGPCCNTVQWCFNYSKYQQVTYVG